MPSTTIRYSMLPENSRQFPRRYPPGFAPGEPSHEPDHLRHQPGDDWQIGGRPHDPLDRGPYGSPGWRPDPRTGRHRRGELPDPVEEDPSRLPQVQEEAFERYMSYSESLAKAHEDDRAALDQNGPIAVAVLARLLRWIVAVIQGNRQEPESRCPVPQGETTLAWNFTAEDTMSLRCIPENQAQRPNAGSAYMDDWERRFDACDPVSRSEVML